MMQSNHHGVNCDNNGADARYRQRNEERVAAIDREAETGFSHLIEERRQSYCEQWGSGQGVVAVEKRKSR
jgi:hypothetical protein